MNKKWKKGRGKLGILQPLIGFWVSDSDSEMGPVRCTRTFEQVLQGSYVRLLARWEFGAGDAQAPEKCSDDSLKGARVYEEIALIGAGEDGQVGFWSFTSDGKRSQGTLADVSDIHEDAIGFEAQMPAGMARMAYWPDQGDGFNWVVESKNAKGWRRFVEHRYRRA